MFEAFMVSCRAREAVRGESLRSLAAGGWDRPPKIVLDDEVEPTPLQRIHRTWRRTLERAAASAARFVLLLEDDIVVGRWFKRNLLAWPVLAQHPPEQAFFASLYNPSLPYHVIRPEENCLVSDPRYVWGAQALVMTPPTARFVLERWNEELGNPDQKMPRLAARVTPIYFHVPSLVNHADVPTTWGGMEHRAGDFDADWLSAHAADERIIASVPPRPVP